MFVSYRSFSGAKGSFKVKAGLAQMLKGGVIMDVVNVEQAKVSHHRVSIMVP